MILPNEKPSLRDLQKWMRWIITDPRGVDEALIEPNPQIPFIEKSPALSQAERLSIYAEGYFARIVESLSQDFSTLHKILGEDSFLKLTADYLKVYPSQSTNIGEVGSKLPGFLKNYSMTKDYPYVFELASLEWMVIESFYADNVLKLDAQFFQNISAKAWPQARFSFDPSVRLVTANWPVQKLWSKKNDSEFDLLLENFTKEKSYLLIFRKDDGQICVRDQELSEYQILKYIQVNESLTKICEQFSEQDEAPPFMECFAKWIQAGVIKQIHFQELP